MLQAQNLLDVLNLSVGADLGCAGLTDIQELAPVAGSTLSDHCGGAEQPPSIPEGKDPIVVPAYNAKSGDCDRFGRVPLREDEGAAVGVLAASIIGVLQLADAWCVEQARLE